MNKPADKDEALWRLWNDTNAAATTATDDDTLRSLASLRIKAYFRAAKKRAVLLSMWKYAAAVALVAALTAAYILTSHTAPAVMFIEQYARHGQLDTLRLPDGSTALMNAGTIIVYPDNFGDNTRTLYLSGEASFNVRKNEAVPFIVQSKHTAVTALGTEFTVSAYAEDPRVKVTLVSGHIKIDAIDNRLTNYISRAGEQFVYDKTLQQYAIRQIDLRDETAWQRGELVFRGATLREILPALERKYAVSFQYRIASMTEDKFNFQFKKESTLPEVMDIIQAVAEEFDYTVTRVNE